MSDQAKPKLTLEEELDVLEAVYKIGQEKGLELLRPEQVKKLKDAGRIEINFFKNSVIGEAWKNKFANDKRIDVFENEVVSTVIDFVGRSIVEENGSDYWNKLTNKQRLLCVNAKMYVLLGLSIEMLRKRAHSLATSLIGG